MVPGKFNGLTEVNKKIHNRNRGFTLVELIVALTLLLIVLDLGYMFFNYGVNTFKGGENQSNVQREIRLSCGYITRELRNSVDMSFVNTAPANDGYNYIVFDSANKVIKIFDKSNTTTPKYKTNNCINTFTYMVSTVDGRYVMNFDVSGTEGTRTFNTTSKVLLTNMKVLPGSANTAAAMVNVATIKYKKP